MAVRHAPELHSVHAPIVERMHKRSLGRSVLECVVDESRRKQAVAEAQAAIAVAAQIPFRYLVVHLGVPTSEQQHANRQSADAARRSVEEIATAATRVNVRVAVEVIPNALSDAASACLAGRRTVRRPRRRRVPRLRSRPLDGRSRRGDRRRSPATCGRRTCTTTAGSATIICRRMPARSTGTPR